MATQDFYQVGGSLRKDLPSYVERQADIDLYQGLQKGEFCYVLAARQMGKSSLSVRMMKRLADEGWAMAYVDLTAFGTTGFNAEQWYFSFLEEIAYMLDVSTDLQTWWDAHSSITPVNRMSQFWEAVILKEISAPIAIFIDEIDAMLGIDEGIFRTNDFFSAIRAAYNKRSTHPVFNRLNFSIFGVATPQDLMNRKNGTPFNIGKEIQVLHFTETEAGSLKNGLVNDETTNQAMLHRILHWTGGQPFLTQTICQKLSAQTCALAEVNKVVDEVVKVEFLRKDILNTPHFGNIENRIYHNGTYNLKMLDIYRQILKEGIYKVNQRGIELHYLKLSGLVQEKENGLKASNYLYTQILDSNWLDNAYGTIDRPITLDLNRWIKTEKAPDALIKGTILEAAEKWAESISGELTNEEQEFLKESRLAVIEEENEKALQITKERQRKRLIQALIITALAAIIAVGAGFFANEKRIEADENRILADLRRDTAELRKIEAERNLRNFLIEQTKKDSIRFKNFNDRTFDLLNTGRCPEDILSEMKLIANSHRDSITMKNRISIISQQGRCKS